MKQQIAEDIVNKIIDHWESGQKEDAGVFEMLTTNFTMSKEDAETILELTKTGLFRAAIISGGHSYPKADLWDNQIVDTAFRIGLTRLGKPELYVAPLKKESPWCKFWKA